MWRGTCYRKVCPSVRRLSLCLSHSYVTPKRFKISKYALHRTGSPRTSAQKRDNSVDSKYRAVIKVLKLWRNCPFLLSFLQPLFLSPSHSSASISFLFSELTSPSVELQNDALRRMISVSSPRSIKSGAKPRAANVSTFGTVFYHYCRMRQRQW